MDVPLKIATRILDRDDGRQRPMTGGRLPAARTVHRATDALVAQGHQHLLAVERCVVVT